MRVGIGTDSHRLAPDIPLVLGGVKVPSDQGLIGHSDADVLVHAIIDALLGACALGDIGSHFPPNDNRYAGISPIPSLPTFLSARNASLVSISCLLRIITRRPK